MLYCIEYHLECHASSDITQRKKVPTASISPPLSMTTSRTDQLRCRVIFAIMYKGYTNFDYVVLKERTSVFAIL